MSRQHKYSMHEVTNSKKSFTLLEHKYN